MTPATTRKPLRLADYYVWNTITEIAVSPDGSRAVYVQRGTRKAKNDHYTNLWLVATDGSDAPYRLTRSLSRDNSPAFSPDGRYLAFLSTRETEIEMAEGQQADAKDAKPKSDKPKTQVWIFDLKYGGEPRQVTTMPEGVSAFEWAPDSARLVLAARTPTPAQQKYLESLRGDEKGPYQLRRMQHKRDGSGFTDEVKTHLHVVDVAGRTVKQITGGPCDETEAIWSPDGEWIAFSSNRTGNADANRRSDIWLVRPDGSESRRLTFGDLGAHSPRWSPDSRQIAFVAGLDPENAYKLRHLVVVDVAAAETVADLAACVGEGWSEIGGIVPDEIPAGMSAVENARRYPVPVKRTPCRVLTAELDRIMMGSPEWLDANTLLIEAGDRGQTRLLKVTTEGKTEFVYPIDRFQVVQNFAVANGKLIMNVDSPLTGPDLYAFPAVNPAGADPVRLTQMNSALLAERTPARYESIEYTGSRGETVHAWVAVPHGWSPEADGPAPVIVSIHGGPMAYDAPSFHFLRQYWAGMGYLVLMVNYHGSISYGEAFCESIRGGWGPAEQGDVEAGVDALVSRGWADPSRLYVTGFSQGGIMTNYAVGHTDRFQAAVSEHGMWNYAMSFGTDDCHLWWQDDIGVPWQNPEGYAKMSPISGVQNVKTPTLIMAGEIDWRCPLVESEQMYISLKKRGVPTQLIVWPGEWHSVSKPRRMVDRTRRICAWFAQYGGLPFEDDSAEGYPDLD